MNILFVASEAHPYSKTGGLADVVGALARALSHQGHRVGVFTPFYRSVRERHPEIEPIEWYFNLPLGSDRGRGRLWSFDENPKLTFYFLEESEGAFDRNGFYQEKGMDYKDNARRFIFFSKCAAHFARHVGWKPEIVHAHDWQAGLVPLFINHQSQYEGWTDAPPTLFTIHNLAYQGNFPGYDYKLTNLPWDYFSIEAGVEFFQSMSCMKSGIVYSDAITTVSPNYASEILTREVGCGMEGALLARRHALTGILNGVDYDEWNTETNPFLKSSFSSMDLWGKSSAKRQLQEELKLPDDPDIPLFATITRLVDQKGVDILIESLKHLLNQGAELQFCLLGSGAFDLEKELEDLQKEYDEQIAVKIGFDLGLSHRIEAGSDFYLMPSRFEPCGLNQMYSLRYGSVPIVHDIGGLHDSVIGPKENLAACNGFKFSEYSAEALSEQIQNAMEAFTRPHLMSHLRENGMRADFSWERSTEKYMELYLRLISRR